MPNENAEKDAPYEPTYKELIAREWRELPESLRAIAEFAEIAAEYVDHLRDE